MSDERKIVGHVDDNADDKGHEYSVGYRRPPKHTRFKRGRSGNPRGRRRMAHEEHDLPFRRYMMETTTAKFNGKKVTVTKFDVVFLKLYQKAMEGDFRSIKLLVEQSGGFKEFRADYKHEMNSADREMIEMVMEASNAWVDGIADKAAEKKNDEES